MPDIQMDEPAADRIAESASFIDLGLDGSGNDIARGQFHLARRVFLHETFFIFIDQMSAFAAAAFGHENILTDDRGWVELNEFHVFQGRSGPVSQRHAQSG